MSFPKFVSTGLRTAWAVGLAPIPLLWAQAAGAPLGAASAGPAGATKASPPVVYRCPGPPVLYTDALSPQEVRSKNCKPLTDLPVAVVVAPAAAKPQPVQPAAQSSGQGTGGTGPVASVAMPDTRIRQDDQRSRDAEARRILEAELRREEERLNDAIKASAGAKPGERAAADAAQIRRAESDIEAIRRELGRLR